MGFCLDVQEVWWQGTDTLCPSPAQQMPTRHEQIGEGVGDEHAMSVLFEPAIAHHDEAEHPLDDAEGIFDLGPHLGLGTVFAASLSSTTPR